MTDPGGELEVLPEALTEALLDRGFELRAAVRILGYGERKKSDDASKVICWLCCDPLPPIALGPQAEVTVGAWYAPARGLPESRTAVIELAAE